jgi:hypothetical protein
VADITEKRTLCAVKCGDDRRTPCVGDQMIAVSGARNSLTYNDLEVADTLSGHLGRTVRGHGGGHTLSL